MAPTSEPHVPAGVGASAPALPVQPRYELLPFGQAEAQAAALAEPVRLTMTASPRHGLERTFELAAALRRQGHGVTPHLAARMVRDRAHLDTLLATAASAGIDDLFVIGGDAPQPAGPYTSAGELLRELADHPLRPEQIGIGGYPEGHPLIPDADLASALRDKAPLATYLVTQLCFDPDVLLRWLAGIRADGLELPAFAGIPGPVDRRRLLEVSVRVGVGPSVSFMRKQRGLRRLLSSPTHAAEHLHDGLAGHLGDPRLGLVGLHYYTFNELEATHRWHQDRAPLRAPAPRGRPWRRPAGSRAR